MVLFLNFKRGERSLVLSWGDSLALKCQIGDFSACVKVQKWPETAKNVYFYPARPLLTLILHIKRGDRYWDLSSEDSLGLKWEISDFSTCVEVPKKALNDHKLKN